MNAFEINKILGATLAALVFIMGLSVLSEIIFDAEPPEQPGYEIAIEESGPAEAVEEVPLAVLLANSDVDAGARVARQCGSCHTFTEGGADGIGPHLHGVVGREIAAVSGFNYSSALHDYGNGEPWTYEKLDHFLANPREAVPGTLMSFAGLRKPEDRANVLAYLKSESPEAPDYPAPPQGEAATAEGEEDIVQVDAQAEAQAETDEAAAENQVETQDTVGTAEGAAEAEADAQTAAEQAESEAVDTGEAQAAAEEEGAPAEAAAEAEEAGAEASTEAPLTTSEQPAAEAPSEAEAPAASEGSAAEAPAEAAATEEPATEAPAEAEAPAATEEPAAEAPAEAETPAATEEPAAEAPAEAETPAAPEQPAAEEPATEEQRSEAPATTDTATDTAAAESGESVVVTAAEPARVEIVNPNRAAE